MKEFILKHKKMCIIIAVILALVILVAIVFATYNHIVKPWNYVIDNAYINVRESMFMQTDIALYSTGTGINEILYLGRQPDEYYIMNNGDVYFYSGPTGRGKVTGIEYGRIFKKIGKVSSVENLKDTLLKEANIDYSFSSKNIYSNKSYILKVDGNEYTTYTNLFDVVDKNLK